MGDKRAAGFIALLLSTLLAACIAPATHKTRAYADMVVGFLEYGSEGAWRAASREYVRETAGALGIRRLLGIGYWGLLNKEAR